MSDTLFQAYDNTKLNLVPLIEGNSRKVYVLTGPQLGGVVILGNDYLLSFNKKHELVSKQKLHQNIIPVSFAEKKEDEAATLHSHLPSTGDYMTPTDICTLLLYANMSNWKQHYTMSENFMSVWEIDKAKLTMVSRKAWEKIMQQQDAAKKQ